MGELANCSRCEAVFVKTIRDICQNCYKEEEKEFNTVYHFLIKRENRESNLMEIVKETGVKENIIIKFIKEKRLRQSKFPKLTYPCERCEAEIIKGRLCTNCSQEILDGVEQHEKMERQASERKAKERKISQVYYTFDKD
ncbi:TIGR03826 family flagellar region protein [Virgibacillus byunsanensis]|uniref:TIGR03826 family flagellar region protein n=1 Tax=Virgibacillus byunsanensis TaxID=570945 RepID=A0ABW3LMF7_9BACI